MLQAPHDPLPHSLREVEAAEMQASRALQDQLQVDCPDLLHLPEHRLRQGKQVLDAVSQGRDKAHSDLARGRASPTAIEQANHAKDEPGGPH